ncbi:MAG: hypothetical protein P8X83_03870 [Nitrosopumilaceae archaeon]|jgi:arginyl-tRNA synthetase
MASKLLVDLLRLVREGNMEISENHKKSLKLSFSKNTVVFDLLDVEFNIPTSKGMFERLSEARKFAKILEENNFTLCISHKGKIVMKLGKDAKPKLSRMLTKSKSVEITNLRELRKLDKRLRLK